MGNDIINQLFQLKDEEYKVFNAKLIPNIDKNTIIGVRIPMLRQIAKDIKNDANIDDFLKDLPHKYLEENHLHAYIIEQIKDYDKCIYEINKFLPYIDNWATCDTLRPKCFNNNLEKLLIQIKKWLKSDHTYTIRFAIEMLMIYFLDKYFSVEYFKWVYEIKTDDYYVKMMVAWYFATALAKQYDEAIKYIENKSLDKWIHNKTIQKAIESYRISADKKVYLRTLKL